jgi:hypothetical protein
MATKAKQPAEPEPVEEDFDDEDDGDFEDDDEEDDKDDDYAGQGAGRKAGEGAGGRRKNDYVDYGAHVRQSDNKGPDTTATLEPLAHATPEQWLGSNNDPDVLLSIPNLGIDRIGLTVDNVRAHVELHAKVLDLVELHVGADVSIKKVLLEIDNVRVQAMLKVKLEKVRDIVGDVIGLLDNNPEILTALTGGLGRGLEGALARKTPDQLEEEERGRKEISGNSDEGGDDDDG